MLNVACPTGSREATCPSISAALRLTKDEKNLFPEHVHHLTDFQWLGSWHPMMSQLLAEVETDLS